jgi:uncharacterized membrane protein YccF (DUF307 family)
MSCFGNFIWLVFGGFFAGLGYIFGGLLVCLTIVGIPFGTQAIKLGVATMAPFGRELVVHPDASEPLNVGLNILWAVFFGWEIAVAHLVSALLLAITIIGLPFARQHIKLLPLSVAPFGRELN